MNSTSSTITRSLVALVVVLLAGVLFLATPGEVQRKYMYIKWGFGWIFGVTIQPGPVVIIQSRPKMMS